jgi:hypothetical protein
MTSARDDAEYFYSLAAEARELMRHSKDDRIVNEALTVIVDAYRALARRAERAKDSAKGSSSLWLLCACQWLSDVADAMVLA